MNRLISTSLAAVAAAGVIAGCSSGGSTPNAAPATTPAVSPTVPSTDAPSAVPPSSPSSLGPVAPSGGSPSLSAQQVADNGLPSKLHAGKLSNADIKRLVQYFENRVSHAYAKGNADTLSHYLAGPMLTGNRGTINLLNSQNRRNVFRIKVQTVKPQANTTNRIILAMTGDMTVNYFFDPRAHKVLNNGLPGPSQVTFTVFLDRNPKTHTWYWTGEKSGTGGVTGAQTVG